MTLEELRAAIDAAVWEQDWHEAFLPPMPKVPDDLVLKSDDPENFNAINAEINTGRIGRTELEQNLARMRAAFEAKSGYIKKS